ncbi:MAG: 3-keto-disaccharide hydrolase, partial [Planctomycetota bacterium]
AVRVFVVCLGLCLVTSCGSSKDMASQGISDITRQTQEQPVICEDMPPGEVSLFDGRNLGQWKITDFGDQGEVYVKDESIMLQIGDSLTGVTWAGPVLRTNYEINLDAMRVDGDDFFCGLTFPVGDSCVTFVVSGWGGSVCGISSIDYYDASDNETTVKSHFDNNRWYHVRVRVRPEKIQCWIDDKQYVDLETGGKKLGVRLDVRDSRPLGIASWRTAAAIKNIRLAKLPEVPATRISPKSPLR